MSDADLLPSMGPGAKLWMPEAPEVEAVLLLDQLTTSLLRDLLLRASASQTAGSLSMSHPWAPASLALEGSMQERHEQIHHL